MKYTLFLFCLNNLVFSYTLHNIECNNNPNNINNNVNNNPSNVNNNQSNVNNNQSNVNAGKATFYFRIGENINGCAPVQTFNDGNRYGPCNYNGNAGVQYNSNSKYWSAISNASSHCGEKITVYYNNKSIQLTIMDECPGCGNNVDMSLDALIELTGSKENACAINLPLPDIKWHFN